MKKQDNDEIENPAELSADDLLRFLEALPQHVRERAKLDASKNISMEVCPPPETYLSQLLGELDRETLEGLEAHVSVCDRCSQRLTESRRALTGDPSPEETAAIAELTAFHGEWQQRMAQRLAATPRRRGLILPLKGLDAQWVWMTAAAAVLVLLAGGFAWQRAIHTPERELAEAYEASRTLELRVPEAGFAAFTEGRHTRGAGADREPAELLDARAKLARALESSPQDARWLELRARADVLEERYDSAIDVLDRLMAQGPPSAELLTDAANAYFQRGLVTGSEVDRSTALDDLARADRLSPADPVVLFNEAIVMEDRGQMMNAVEVWNRYITVERDAKWREEGKRKLAALEQTLNRLKSHESRVGQMLATPAAMDALASDAKTLAALDEELSAYKLDRILLPAFPEATGSVSGLEQARGSPCPASCVAARRLLHAIGNSLEIDHRDSWLNDLLPREIEALPTESAESYGQGLRLLARAIHYDVEDVPKEGARAALSAEEAFRRSGQLAENRDRLAPTIRRAEHVAELRAAVEHLFALQLQVDYVGCRAEAAKLHEDPEVDLNRQRYPWMAAQAETTEKLCDDTPETRAAGRALAASALQTAETARYRLMAARVRLRFSDEARDTGDDETAERYDLESLASLYSEDSPALRMYMALGTLEEIENQSQRPHVAELYLEETMQWAKLLQFGALAAQNRMNLAVVEVRNGEMREAAEQLKIAYVEGSPQRIGNAEGANFTVEEEDMATAMLERGDLPEAARNLDSASPALRAISDVYLLRLDAVNRGQLELALGNANRAAETLESAIRLSEGSDVRRGDRATSAELGELDRDVYAELAASWLAEGRSPESALALWERFRLRSRGLPIAQCRAGALDCELPRLEAERRRLGESVVVGQIVLLDRVLVYRMDRGGVRWSERRTPRQGLLDAAQALERAVSSPYTSPETTAALGAGLTRQLLPDLPASLPDNGALLLEPDPLLANLSWPVLPAGTAPLGIAYPLAELRSILAPADGFRGLVGGRQGERALVVGASVAAEGEPPLPEALREAEHVDRLLHAPEMLLGERATAAQVGADLGKATIFHFAGHAVQTPDGTELLLAAAFPGDKSAWVDGKFLRQHPPRACRLAVLSACGTGVREAAWNHPLQNMVETLGALGVPEVVATRWQIDSEASVPLIDSFYRGLAQGDSAALALANARRVQFASSSFKNPYYWGACYVTGREIDHPIGEFHAHR